ncbi:MAG: cohesin domain-containing protein [Lachnospiraceae bacterium]|nr:cohesin domain-containing protein [Lachnospiraceae bacterium]
MRRLKKISIFFVLALVMVLNAALPVFAADGTIHFEDATGGVGQEFTVNATVSTAGEPIGDATIVFTYDPALLEFVSGTEASAEDGTVTMFASGDGAATSLQYSVTFRGLAEGTSQLTVIQYITWYYTGEALFATFNSPTITVSADGGGGGAVVGDGVQVELQGGMYTIHNNFADAMVPAGFSRVVRSVQGQEQNGMAQDASGNVFFYLVTGVNDPVLAMYNEGAGTFSAAEFIPFSDDFYIIILDQGQGVPLPSHFQQTTIDVNGTIFPAWQNTDATDFFLVYALSSSGNEGFYLYDSVEKTYQRFDVTMVQVAEEEEEAESSGELADRVVALINDHIMVFLIAVFALILLLLIIIIVLSAKLNRRNNELEDVYDDHYDNRGGYDDDEYEDDDTYDDDEYDDDDDEYDGDEYGDEYEDDDEYDDEYDDDEEGEHRKEDFNLDFIDL